MPKVELWLAQDKYIQLMTEAAELGMSIGEYVKYAFLALHAEGVDGGKVLGMKVRTKQEKARERKEKMERPRGVV